jgi:hypothetical protein
VSGALRWVAVLNGRFTAPGCCRELAIEHGIPNRFVGAVGVSGCDGEEPTMCSGRPEEHLGGGTTEQTALGPRRVRVGRKG